MCENKDKTDDQTFEALVAEIEKRLTERAKKNRGSLRKAISDRREGKGLVG